MDSDRLDRVAVDFRNQRRPARGRTEVDRADVEEFQRLVGTRRLQPDDGDAGCGGLPFEQPLFAS